LALFGILTSVIGRAMLSSLFGVEEDVAPLDDLPVDAPPDPSTPSAGTADPVDLELITRLMRENEQLRLERDRLRTTAGN
ncbi:MAG TPA: hypothetical protein VFX49_21020, partial [Chloroflexota bacterium]|nr:hypothetical protein [Chloroflexota bacterium]